MIVRVLIGSAAYGGTALAFRDRLVVDWNKTQQAHTFADQKRVYCKWTDTKGDADRQICRSSS